MKSSNRVGARWIAFQFANYKEVGTTGRSRYLPTVGAIVQYRYLGAVGSRGNGARGRACAAPRPPRRALYLV